MPSIACPTCNSKLKAPDNVAGKQLKCPKCSAMVLVPASQAGSSDSPVSIQSEKRQPPPPMPSPPPVTRDYSPSVSNPGKSYKPCSFCGEDVLANAKVCKHCGGEVIDVAMRDAQEVKRSLDQLTQSGAGNRGVKPGTDGTSPLSRTNYILLGLFLGAFGVHNFAAGRLGCAIGQLVIFLVSIPLMCVAVGFFTVWISAIWAIIEVATVRNDGQGRLMV